MENLITFVIGVVPGVCLGSPTYSLSLMVKTSHL
nr:MAG TPA: hypothetical protein [Bacteriophage sp.]